LKWLTKMVSWPLAVTLARKDYYWPYRNGISPWYNEDEPIVWWCPDPRFVLFPEKTKSTKSMQTVLQNGKFRFTINRAFSQVIQQCKSTRRKEQEGTWITPAIQDAYLATTPAWICTQCGAWLNGELVGGFVWYIK
jgi:leucyl/phenylalanyl-tRNA--protein transferase